MFWIIAGLWVLFIAAFFADAPEELVHNNWPGQHTFMPDEYKDNTDGS